MAIVEYVKTLLSAKYTLPEIFSKALNFYDKVMADPNVTGVTDFFKGYIDKVASVMPYIMIAIFAVVALGGKRLLPVLKFIAMFVGGFFLGIYSLSPIVIDVMPAFPALLIGLITGVVAVVLTKLIYNVLLIVCAAYGTYLVCYTGFLTGFTKGNLIIGLAAAVVVVLVVIFLRKYVEMGGTALFGGLGIALAVKRVYDYTAISVFEGREKLAILAIAGVIGLIAFFIQFKTRVRYK